MTIGPEPPPVEGAQWIRLTQGYFALVDEDDYAGLKDFFWAAVVSRGGKCIYAYRRESRHAMVAMHAQVMGYPQLTVDHIRAGATLDNRRSNLRLATRAQQSRNRRKFSGHTSRYKGVSAHNGGWATYIHGNDRAIYVGQFDNEVDAALAYDAHARLLHLEFARLNFPNPGEQPATQTELT